MPVYYYMTVTLALVVSTCKYAKYVLCYIVFLLLNKAEDVTLKNVLRNVR